MKRAKVKVVGLEEILHKRKEHFKNLLGNTPEITDKPIHTIINDELDIKLRQFTEEEPDTVLKKIKIRKAAVLYEIPLRFGIQEKFTT